MSNIVSFLLRNIDIEIERGVPEGTPSHCITLRSVWQLGTAVNSDVVHVSYLITEVARPAEKDLNDLHMVSRLYVVVR